MTASEGDTMGETTSDRTEVGAARGDAAVPDVRALDAAHVMQTYGRVPVVFVRGEGSRLWDRDGREYLDFLSGLAVASLGHAHPEVADAVAEQARTLLHVSNLYHNEHQAPLAARLDALLGGGGRTFFCNSGAEANECALKLARRWGARRGGFQRVGVVTALRSFHGRSLATLAATGQPEKQEPFRPLPEGYRHVPFGDTDALAEAVDGRVAAVLLEAVQGEGGVRPAPPGYLEAAREVCDRHGALLILDEVQAGLGRTGRWFAFEHAGIRPDAVTMAKALGNGMPIGACWARDEVASVLGPGDHAATFGGQPLAARAAITVLDVMRREDAPGRAARAGERLAEGLSSLRGVASVRGHGLLLGATLEPGTPAAEVVGACLERGLVVNAVASDVVRFAPPLLVSGEEIDEAVAIVERALSEVTGAPEVGS